MIVTVLFFLVSIGSSIVGAICGIGGGVMINSPYWMRPAF